MICKICGKEMEKQHTWRKHKLHYKDENSNDIYPVYTITCLHIAPIYFHVKANKNNYSYIVSIIDNSMNLRYESGGYISSLEKALEDVMDIYKDDIECHVKLYNIITNNM